MPEQKAVSAPEPWMRDTHADLDPMLRAVIHALELAEEDIARWCGNLNDTEMFARPDLCEERFQRRVRYVLQAQRRFAHLADARAHAAETDAGAEEALNASPTW